MLNTRGPWALNVNPDGYNALGTWLERDEIKSTLEIANLLEGKPVNPEEGEIYLKISGPKWRKIEDFHILPFTVSTPIISDELRNAISSIVPASQVSFFPVTIWHPSGGEWTKWILIPLLQKACVDFSRSEIRSWLIPNRVVLFFNKLRFRDNCLEENFIVRNENLPSQILYSGILKNKIEKYLVEAFVFQEDFDISGN